jgi:hypothetical protein
MRRDIQKIAPLIRNYLPIPQKLYNITKRLKTLQEIEQYFPGFLSFIDSIQKRFQGLRIKEERRGILFWKEK